MKNLQDGLLDDQKFLFTKGLQHLEKAFRAVKSGNPPSDTYFADWFGTFRDIYNYHPRGTDVAFWRKLLDMVRARKKS